MADLSKLNVPIGGTATTYNLKDKAVRDTLIEAQTSNKGKVWKTDATTGVPSWQSESGGTTVTPNPSGTASTELAKIGIEGTNYYIKDTTYSAATTSEAGLMSAADKTKLDGIKETYIRCEKTVASDNPVYCLLYELPNFSYERATNYPIKARGNFGISDIRQCFDVSFMIEYANETNGVTSWGFVSSSIDHDFNGDLIVTYNSSDNTVRLYAKVNHADLELYLTTPDNGTVYTNPTPISSYSGTLRASLSNIASLPTIMLEKTVTLGTTDTDVVFSSLLIEKTAVADIYAGRADGNNTSPNVFPHKSLTISNNNSLTITFPALPTATQVKVRIYLR